MDYYLIVISIVDLLMINNLQTTMFKQVLFVLLIALVFAEDICPASKFNKCEAEVIKGTQSTTKPSKHANKALTLSACNTLWPLRRTAGLASARSPNNKVFL